MASRQPAYIEIISHGETLIEKVDGRLGSGRLEIADLQNTATGRKELDRIAKISEAWHYGVMIAFARKAGVPHFCYKGELLPTSTVSRMLEGVGTTPKRLMKKVPNAGDEPIYRVFEEGDPEIKIAGEVANRWLLVTTHLPTNFRRLLQDDMRFRGIEVLIIGEDVATVTKEALKPMERFFERDNNLLNTNISGKERMVHAIAVEKAMGIASTPGVQNAIPTSTFDNPEFGKLLRAARKVAEPLKLKIAMLLCLGTTPEAPFTDAAHRFGKKARKAAKAIKIH